MPKLKLANEQKPQPKLPKEFFKAIMDTFFEGCAGDVTQRALINMLAVRLWKNGADAATIAQEMPLRLERYKEIMPNAAPTPFALVKHWGICKPTKPKSGVDAVPGKYK